MSKTYTVNATLIGISDPNNWTWRIDILGVAITRKMRIHQITMPTERSTIKELREKAKECKKTLIKRFGYKKEYLIKVIESRDKVYFDVVLQNGDYLSDELLLDGYGLIKF